MARPTLFGALAALTVIFAAASFVHARPGRLIAPDGKRLEGDVTENQADKSVEIVSEGKRYKFKTAALRGPVEYDDSISVPQRTPPQPGQQPPAGQQPGQQPQPGASMSAEEEFAKRRAALAPADAAGRVRLARWAFEREEYDLARDVAQEAVTIDRRNQEAQEMLRTIDAQRRLNRKPPAGQQPPAGRPPAQGGAPAQPGAPGGDMPANRAATGADGKTQGNGLVPPLSADEVNRVRLLEWHGDRTVRIRLLNDVKRRYLAGTDIRPGDFNKMDAVDQAWEMKKKGSPELFNDIRLTNDPPAMQEYRTIVQRAVLTGCATAACHGGGAGSDRFALHARADNDGEAYANFITLHKYQYKPEKGTEASMIDRNRPEDSLLVQFGLAPDLANMPHPQVEGYRPLFRTRNDQKLKQVVRWISDSLSPLQDDYGVPFEAEADRAAQPAAGSDPQQPGEQPGSNDVAPGQGAAGQGAPPRNDATGPATPQRPGPGGR